MTSPSFPQESEFGTVARGAGTTLVGRVVGSALRYGGILFLARALGADSFGRFMLGLALFQLLELTAAMGLPQGIVHRVSLYRTHQDERRLNGALLSSVGLSLGAGVVVGTGLFAGAPWIASEGFSDPALVSVLRVFATGLPFSAAGLVAAMATTGFQTTRYLVYGREFLHPAVFVAIIAAFALVGLTETRAAGAWIGAAVATLLASAAFLTRLAPRWRQRSCAPSGQGLTLLRFSLPLWPAALAGFALVWTDTLVLGYFRPATDVGIYRAAAQTALILMMILHALNSIVGPRIAALYQRREMAQMQRLFRTTARWSLTLTLPAFALLALAREEVLSLFGAEYVAGTWPLLVLAIGQLLNAATGSVGFALIMTGKTYHYLAGDLAMTGLNIALNVALIPPWGLVGAATATAISLTGANLVRLVQAQRLLNLSPFSVATVKPLIAGAVSSGAAWGALTLAAEAHVVVRIAVAALTLGVSYLATICLLGTESEDREGMRALWPFAWTFRDPQRPHD